MHELKTGYKIAFYWPAIKAYSSYIDSVMTCVISVSYRDAQWTYGNNGPLMLFDSMQSAREYSNIFHRVYIREVLYVPMEPRTNQLLGSWDLIAASTRDVRAHWTNPGGTWRKVDAPAGTVFAAAIFFGAANATKPDDAKIASTIDTFGRKGDNDGIPE